MTTRATGKDRFHLHWACDAGSRGSASLPRPTQERSRTDYKGRARLGDLTVL